MKRSYAIAPLFFTLFASTTLAADVNHPERVLELFTSQGCSSCPPANNFAAGMANTDPETLVLTYGVTYWDYLGWKDTFAKPEFTQRQKAYNLGFESANVYTPQLIINGSTHSPHYSSQDVQSMDLPDDTLDLTITRTASGFDITAPERGANRKFITLLVEYVPGPQSVPVERGENRGRVLGVSNVVTDVHDLGLWDLQSTLTSNIALTPGKAYAVLLHDETTMRLETAAWFKPD